MSASLSWDGPTVHIAKICDVLHNARHPENRHFLEFLRAAAGLPGRLADHHSENIELRRFEECKWRQEAAAVIHYY
jgi:hypothetical protein